MHSICICLVYNRVCTSRMGFDLMYKYTIAIVIDHYIASVLPCYSEWKLK